MFMGLFGIHMKYVEKHPIYSYISYKNIFNAKKVWTSKKESYLEVNA